MLSLERIPTISKNSAYEGRSPEVEALMNEVIFFNKTFYKNICELNIFSNKKEK